jgi:hypothetical protein
MFDVFKRLPDGNFVWISERANLQAATDCVARLRKVVEGDYLIHSQTHGLIEPIRGRHAA